MHKLSSFRLRQLNYKTKSERSLQSTMRSVRCFLPWLHLIDYLSSTELLLNRISSWSLTNLSSKQLVQMFLLDLETSCWIKLWHGRSAPFPFFWCIGTVTSLDLLTVELYACWAVCLIWPLFSSESFASAEYSQLESLFSAFQVTGLTQQLLEA